MKKYKVTTSTPICAGDLRQDDDWIFDTREEAQEFVDRFHEAFPKDESSRFGYGRNAYDPYIYTTELIPEIKEIDNDPYAFLEKMVAGRNKFKDYLQRDKDVYKKEGN